MLACCCCSIDSTPVHCTCMLASSCAGTWIEPARQHTLRQSCEGCSASVSRMLVLPAIPGQPVIASSVLHAAVHTAAESHCSAVSTRSVQTKPLQQRQWMHPLPSRQHNTQHTVHSRVRLHCCPSWLPARLAEPQHTPASRVSCGYLLKRLHHCTLQAVPARPADPQHRQHLSRSMLSTTRSRLLLQHRAASCGTGACQYKYAAGQRQPVRAAVPGWELQGGIGAWAVSFMWCQFQVGTDVALQLPCHPWGAWLYPSGNVMHAPASTL